MRLNSIATRIAVTLVLTVVLSFALVVTLSVSGKYLLNRMQGQYGSESHIFASRFLIGVINRHHNPQMISSRIAATADAVAKADAASRPLVLAALTDPAFHAEIRGRPSLEVNSGVAFVEHIGELIAFQLQAAPGPVRVARHPPDAGSPDAAKADELLAEVALPDGNWLAVTGSDFFAEDAVSRILITIFVFLALLIAALSIWTARRLTRPISAFAAAAERFGTSTEAIPLAETGPQELRTATRAFNQMQDRLRRFVSDRTLMVAAISHDLKTPLTRMRLRAELITNDAQQSKMLSDIDEMAAMIDSTLAFASDDAKREAPLLVDLGALIEGACENAADTGHDVEMASVPQAVLVTCRPVAISRAVANLIDNAVKYGGCARVRLDRIAGRAIVTVEDDGPGIPEDEFERVFAPFYRLEGSRNRDTGGVGLGLAVARTAAREHGGDLTLGSSASGGLLARFELPVVDPPRANNRARRLVAAG